MEPYRPDDHAEAEAWAALNQELTTLPLQGVLLFNSPALLKILRSGSVNSIESQRGCRGRGGGRGGTIPDEGKRRKREDSRRAF